MAIYSSVPPPSQQPSGLAGPDIEAWSVSALESLRISPTARGTGIALSVPLDQDKPLKDATLSRPATYKPRKELLKRDSQKHRESLLKGKEGSRRRQRWENGECSEWTVFRETVDTHPANPSQPS